MKTETKIIFSSGDDCFARARKLWKFMGFVNDRHGTANILAEGLSIYARLDSSPKEQNKRKA